jgi:hypothetical protein
VRGRTLRPLRPEQLGNVYKPLDAPYGAFAHDLIVGSTTGIRSNDTAYLTME